MSETAQPAPGGHASEGLTSTLIGVDGTEYPLAGVAQVIYAAHEPEPSEFATAIPIPLAEPERVPWTAYVLLAYTAALTTVGVYEFGRALVKIHPLLAIVINVVAVGGAAPTVWPWRAVPLRRWVVYGVVAGVALGWIALLTPAVIWFFGVINGI